MPDRYGDEPDTDAGDDRADHSLAAKRGMYLIRQVLEKKQNQEESTSE